MKIPTIPADKAQHFVYGVVVALVVLYAALALGVEHHAAKILAAFGALFVGVVKEGLDYLANKRNAEFGEEAPSPHTVDGMDAVATALGGVAVWIA